MQNHGRVEESFRETGGKWVRAGKLARTLTNLTRPRSLHVLVGSNRLETDANHRFSQPPHFRLRRNLPVVFFLFRLALASTKQCGRIGGQSNALDVCPWD